LIVSKLRINKVVNELRKGNIVLVPTETVFGVAVIYNNEQAFQKLMELKHRPLDKHFPVCVGSVEQIQEVAVFNEELVNELLPNPLTLILNTNKLPKYMDADSVAIRYPQDRFLNKVCKKLHSPILLTSANISGEKPIESIEEAIKIFNDKISVYVKGKVKIGKPSTIIKINNNKVEVLREGPLSKEDIIKMIGD